MPLSHFNPDQERVMKNEWEIHLLQVWKIMLDHVSFDEEEAVKKARAYLEGLERRHPDTPRYEEMAIGTMIRTASEGLRGVLDEVRQDPGGRK